MAGTPTTNQSHHRQTSSLTNSAFDDLEYPEPEGSNKVPAPSPRRPWIHKIHLFMDSPKSSTPAMWYAIIMLGVILVSTVAFLVSSLPKYYNKSIFTELQLIAGSIFTADYVLRLITADYWYRWMLRPLSIIDLFVVVPFLVSLVPSITLTQQFIALRAVRLLYILKIIKITSYVHMTRVVARTLKKSKDGFVVLLVGVIVMCLFYSTLIFIAENTGGRFDTVTLVWYRKGGERSDFQSIFDGIWWCLVTFTTVGYGDMYPTTTFGRVVGVFTMFTGVLLTALPVAIFTANFTELWKERKFQRRADYIEELAEQNRGILTAKRKQEEMLELLAAIEKEERLISGAIQTARENIEEANSRHKHMQVLIAQLRYRITAEEGEEVTTTEDDDEGGGENTSPGGGGRREGEGEGELRSPVEEFEVAEPGG